MSVLDASAVLAFLHGEPGADDVEDALGAGAIIGAANWSEVAQKVRSRGGDWDQARALIFNYELRIEPVRGSDAEQAAAMWKPGSGLSLADRLCLALGIRLSKTVLTADSEWGSSEVIRQIR